MPPAHHPEVIARSRQDLDIDRQISRGALMAAATRPRTARVSPTLKNVTWKRARVLAAKRRERDERVDRQKSHHSEVMTHTPSQSSGGGVRA